MTVRPSRPRHMTLLQSAPGPHWHCHLLPFIGGGLVILTSHHNKINNVLYACKCCTGFKMPHIAVIYTGAYLYKSLCLQYINTERTGLHIRPVLSCGKWEIHGCASSSTSTLITGWWACKSGVCIIHHYGNISSKIFVISLAIPLDKWEKIAKYQMGT